MGVIAGFLAQNFLKWALNFGEVSYLLNYNALSNFFHGDELIPNPQCQDENCVKLQQEFSQTHKSRKPKIEKAKEKEEKKQEKESELENTWGFKIVEDSEGEKNLKETKDMKTSELSLNELKDQFKLLSRSKNK